MKNNAAHFRDLRQKTMDGQLTRIAVNAQSIAMNARRIPTLFPAGSLGTVELPARVKADTLIAKNRDTSRLIASAIVESIANGMREARPDIILQLIQDLKTTLVHAAASGCRSLDQLDRELQENRNRQAGRAGLTIVTAVGCLVLLTRRSY